MEINVNATEGPGRKHLLVVDDDPDVLEITTSLLKYLGYLVTVAKGSKEAITKITENPDIFDAVFTDYSLPIINGVELSKMIKELSSNIPIILCSGKIDLIDERQIAAAGIAGIARKPYSMNELDSIIKRVFNEN